MRATIVAAAAVPATTNGPHCRTPPSNAGASETNVENVTAAPMVRSPTAPIKTLDDIAALRSRFRATNPSSTSTAAAAPLESSVAEAVLRTSAALAVESCCDTAVSTPESTDSQFRAIAAANPRTSAAVRAHRTLATFGRTE